MLKAIGFLVKVSLFAVLVLVLGNWLKWGDRTISDQVKTQLAHAERSTVAQEVRHMAGNLSRDARKGVQKHFPSLAPGGEEEIPSTERQKLRALMRELNTGRAGN